MTRPGLEEAGSGVPVDAESQATLKNLRQLQNSTGELPDARWIRRLAGRAADAIEATVRALCPPERYREIHTLLPFKTALAEQLGIVEGFRAYREALGLPESYRLELRQVKQLRGFAAVNSFSFREIYPAGEPFEIPPQRVIGDSDARSIIGTSRSFYVTCLADARIQPHSALVNIGDNSFLDYQGDELTLFDDSPQLDPCIFHMEGDVAWIIVDDRKAIEIDEAYGSLIGPRSTHFGHWLWEYLPKYLTAVAMNALPKAPILINDCTSETLREALDLFVPEGVEIIEIPSRPFSAITPVKVRRLWYTPNLFHEPYFEIVNERYPGIDHRCCPPRRFRPALHMMDTAANVHNRDNAGTDRIFLARAPHLHRRIINGDRIEKMLASRGFTIYYPEDYPFAVQLNRVRNARFIIGPDGSQMLTALFARAGTKICFLNHQHIRDVLAGSYIFTEAGADVTIFTGHTASDNHNGSNPKLDFTHDDYVIDEALFARFLDDWLADNITNAE